MAALLTLAAHLHAHVAPRQLLTPPITGRLAASRMAVTKPPREETPVSFAEYLSWRNASAQPVEASQLETRDAAPAAPTPSEMVTRDAAPAVGGAIPEERSLMQKVKDAGLAGAISYMFWELGFWGISIPVCILGYKQVTGHWPDFESQEDLAQLGAEAFAFVNLARFAVPLRIGLALGTAPWVQSNILDRFRSPGSAPPSKPPPVYAAAPDSMEQPDKAWVLLLPVLLPLVLPLVVLLLPPPS